MPANIVVFIPNDASVIAIASFLAAVQRPVVATAGHADGVDIAFQTDHAAITNISQACTRFGYSFGGNACRQLPKVSAVEKPAEEATEETPASFSETSRRVRRKGQL